LRGPPLRLLAVLAVGAAIRLLLAPGSAGSDIPQFLGFARSISPSPCMYQHAIPLGEEWPYPWPYPYGPVLAFILWIVHSLVCPCTLDYGYEGGSYIVVVDPAWALSLKLVYTFFDLAIAAGLYAIWSRRDRRAGLLAAAAYSLSPMAIYITAIYGMFDAIPTAVFTAGLALAVRGRRIAAGALMGLAAATKHTLMLPALASTIAMGAGPLMAALMALGAASSLFILCPTTTAFYALAARVAIPGPTEPIVYSFNGLSSLATYLYRQGWEDALILVKLWVVPFTVLVLAALYRAARRRDPVDAALMAYAAFIAAYWRVNPQYMLTLVALGLAALPGLIRRLRAPLLAALALANAWPILYPSEFWYYVHVPEPGPAQDLVARATLDVLDPLAYVVLSLTITASLYILVIAGALECRSPTCWSEESGS